MDSNTNNSPVGSICCPFLLPCSKHINTLSGGGGCREGCDNPGLLFWSATEVRGQISPVENAATQSDDVSIGDGTIKKLTRHF